MRNTLLRRALSPPAPRQALIGVPEGPAAQAAMRGEDTLDRHVLSLDLAEGDVAHIRRSSLMLAEGAFGMKTRRIASKRVPVMGLFSGQNLWANRFEAEGPARLVAGRDYHGIVLGLTVTEAQPVWLQPSLYLGHAGALGFTVKRVARREFWTLTRVTGEGIVYVKVPGRTFTTPLTGRDLIVDTNYVAAIRGAFSAHGKVFSAGQYLRSGEAENVRLTGDGDVIMQTELPPEAGGGGILGGLLDLFI